MRKYSIDPDALAHLSANVGETSLAVEAKSLKATIAEHASHLGIFWKEFVRTWLGTSLG